MNRTADVVSLAVGIAGFVLLETHKRRFENVTSGGKPIPVLVARGEVALGAAITEDMLGVRDLPEAYLEPRHIPATDLRRVVGVRSSARVGAGESLLWSDLASVDGRRSLSSLVRPGQRAYTVRSEEGTLAQLVRPGDRVDLLLTTAEGAETVAYPLLQNLLVLAVGMDLGDGAEEVGSTRRGARRQEVTVALSLANAQLLSVATRSGNVVPVLRNPDDITVQEGALEVKTADLSHRERQGIPQPRDGGRKKDTVIERVR